MKAGDGVSHLAEGLTADERILSAGEKELLTRLLRHAKSANGCGEMVETVIARAVGEVVSERTQLVLGKSVLQLLMGNAYRLGSAADDATRPERPESTQTPRTKSAGHD